ncbi:DUF3267 domain-containing protein [Phytohabitans sp. LJ34]|uniref:DUF3267 domain-containing protein n=1 Tax=Phytohabitans sp. LJ34 TaxID=3452217 RepID=UPI003F8BEDF0
MRARRSLPDGFVLGGTLRLHGNPRLRRTLSWLSLPWGLASVVALGFAAGLVRPEGWTVDARDTAPAVFLAVLVGGLVATPVLTLVAHEAIHGVLLWAFTGTRPVFGFKGWYAYADAPGWFLPRASMVVVLAAPLVALPALALPLVAFGSVGLSMFALLGLFVNAVAAIGDVYMIAVAVRIRGPVYFGDAPGARPGEAGSWYVPERSVRR